MCFAQRPLHTPVDIVDFITDNERFKLLVIFAEDVKAVLFLWFEEINSVTLSEYASWKLDLSLNSFFYPQYDASRGMVLQMQTTFMVPIRACWENKAAGDQRGGVRAGGARRLSPKATTRMETSALSEDVCRQTHLQISLQIDQSPALKVLLCENQLFTLKWDLQAENKQAARRECHTNAAASGRFLHHKLFKGQQRPDVTPLDREMDSLVSAAWHLHHVLSKWPWRQGRTGRKGLERKASRHNMD